MTQPKKLALANLPTPIHKLERLSLEVGKHIYCWRDDFTGFVESGNKVRKLEFVLAEAIEQRATVIITCGGLQSNHVRATVFLARRLGMKTTVVIREPKEGIDDDDIFTANYLLDQIAGARIQLIAFDKYRSAGSIYDPFLEEQKSIEKSGGEIPYVIPEGASCSLGVWGYLEAVGEMLKSWEKLRTGSKSPDSLFFALGSGGTHAGLHLGFEKYGLGADRVHAVNVCDDERYFQKRVGKLIEETCERYFLKRTKSLLHIHDGYVGLGYSLATDEDLEFYLALARKEGVLLDPCYTGKAFQGMLSEIKRNPGHYGSHILFLHSGGTLGNFAYSEQYTRVLRKGK